MTVSTDGTDLWKVPVDGTANGTASWGHQGMLMLSEQAGTHFAVAGHQAWHLDTSAVFNSTASACRFHPRNDRLVT